MGAQNAVQRSVEDGRRELFTRRASSYEKANFKRGGWGTAETIMKRGEQEGVIGDITAVRYQ